MTNLIILSLVLALLALRQLRSYLQLRRGREVWRGNYAVMPVILGRNGVYLTGEEWHEIGQAIQMYGDDLVAYDFAADTTKRIPGAIRYGGVFSVAFNWSKEGTKVYLNGERI